MPKTVAMNKITSCKRAIAMKIFTFPYKLHCFSNEAKKSNSSYITAKTKILSSIILMYICIRLLP